MVIKNKSHITIDCSTLTWLFWISNFKGLFHITVNLNFHKLGFWNFFQLKAFTASKEISSQLFKMYWCTNHDISGFNCLSWSFIFHYVICMIYWFQKHWVTRKLSPRSSWPVLKYALSRSTEKPKNNKKGNFIDCFKGKSKKRIFSRAYALINALEGFLVFRRNI